MFEYICFLLPRGIMSGGYAEMTAAEEQWLRQSEIIHCVRSPQLLRIFDVLQLF